jgi:hypothetical protein
MTYTAKNTAHTLRICMLGIIMTAFSIAAPAAEEADEGSGRAMAVTMEAVVVDIDLETRQVSLQGPGGNIVTMTSQENVVKLEDINVGDKLLATYLASLEGELRVPTEEELAEPWLVMEEAAMSEPGEQPAIGGARVIRAVCTIEGLNRILGVVTIKDPRGKLHMIGDVEPEKMEGVTLGQTIVIVYTEAIALALEQK